MRKSIVGPSIAPLRPPAHSIWATFLPPRSADWASVSACSTPASNAAVRLPNGWPLTWNVLLVEPATPGHAPVASVNQPAPVFGGAWVSRPLPDALRAVAQQVAEAGHGALVGVLRDRVLAQAVGGEEQQLVVAARRRHRHRPRAPTSGTRRPRHQRNSSASPASP